MVKLKAVLLLVFVVFVTSCSDSQPNDLSFDSVRWKEGNVRVRGQMVRSLLNQQQFVVGKSVAETKELLGEPSIQAKDIITYRISWGSFEENTTIIKYYLLVELDEETQKVKKLDLGDA